MWDKRPSADELLDARLARGWKPTASELQSGPAILGHAACVIAKKPAGQGNCPADVPRI